MQLSEEQQHAFFGKIWEILKWQAGKYNGTDSTSMPEEKAEDLLKSLIYTLFLTVQEDNLAIDTLLQGNFRLWIQRGQKILERKREKNFVFWTEMINKAPQINNVYFVETLKNLGLFFQCYDIYYGAHEIPCSIDYPLMNPVSEDKQGISYIEEYLTRLNTENEFINRFNLRLIEQLFFKNVSEYEDNYFNFCELVFTNAIGRKLLGQNIFSLDISKEEINALNNFFKEKDDVVIGSIFKEAALSVCKETEVAIAKRCYFEQASAGLCARAITAAKNNSLSNVFLSIT